MGLVRITTAFILAVIVGSPERVTAIQGAADIDITELRSAGTTTAKPQQPSSTKTTRRKTFNRTNGKSGATLPANGNISITSAQPCKLARDMSEKMGLLATSPAASVQGGETVSATCAGLNVTVACGLSRAELYTYERLLSPSGGQLLIFEGGESEERVVEKLANHLGLLFRKSDPDADKPPLSYIFAPFGAWTQELKLTILAAPDTPLR